jgi:uncharacterized protein YeaO (DUF488 family)
VKTSYFARCKNQPNAVAITVAKPRWFKGKWYKKLAPPKELVFRYKAGKIDEEQYTKTYLKCIKDRSLTPQAVLEDLGDDAILLCFEGRGKFCHRHIVSKWLREGGIGVEEL